MNLFAILTFLMTGFLLGLKHSLDGDHIVAISAIVSQNKESKKSALEGAIWGVGHTFTLLISGLLILLLRFNITIIFGNLLELLVGLVLVYLGISVAFRLWREKYHFHKHKHREEKHSHLHGHRNSKRHNHKHKSFFVGSIHGLAGSAGLMLIVLPTAESLYLGLFFILIFGIGSIIGMAIFGLLASFPFKFQKNKVLIFQQSFKLLIAFSSISIGLNKITQII